MQISHKNKLLLKTWSTILFLNAALVGTCILCALSSLAIGLIALAVNVLAMTVAFFATEITGYLFNTSEINANNKNDIWQLTNKQNRSVLDAVIDMVRSVSEEARPADQDLEINLQEVFEEVIGEYAKKGHQDIATAYKNGELKFRISERVTPNAFATGLWPSRASVTLYQGCLNAIDKVDISELKESDDFYQYFNEKYTGTTAEKNKALKRNILKAILIHEVGHIAHRDSALKVFISCVVSTISVLSGVIFDVLFALKASNKTVETRQGKDGVETRHNSHKEMQSRKPQYTQGEIARLRRFFSDCVDFTFGHVAKFFSRARESYADTETVNCDHNKSLHHELVLGLQALSKYGYRSRQFRFSHYFSESFSCFSHLPPKEGSVFCKPQYETGWLSSLKSFFFPSSHPEHAQRFEDCDRYQKQIAITSKI